MKGYFLHKKGKKINDNYEYNKFIYLVWNKNSANTKYITGFTFTENYTDKNLCPHDISFNCNCQDNDEIEASESTFDNYIYPVCKFIRIHIFGSWI